VKADVDGESVCRRASVGHDLDYCRRRGLAGAEDPAVLAAEVSANRFLITLDRGSETPAGIR
jgi:hypothetical protein